MASSVSPRGGAIVGINVIPLVDITLVLLIILMVTARLSRSAEAAVVARRVVSLGELAGDLAGRGAAHAEAGVSWRLGNEMLVALVKRWNESGPQVAREGVPRPALLD